MSTMKLTVYGLNHYLSTIDSSDNLFTGLTFPTGIDKDVVVDNILLKSADFELLYSDPDFLKEMIAHWGEKWYPTFERWVNALAIEYDPLNNFDRYEEWEDSGTSASTNTGTGNVSSNSKTTDTAAGTTDTDHYVTPYDSGTTTLDSRDRQTFTNRTDTADTEGNSSTSTSNTGTGSTTGKHKGHLYGNIGVTTSQQMLESELKIAEWNLVEHITDIFLQDFCILVY